MSSPLPYGITPEEPEQPRLHSDRDLDIVIKLVKEIQKFMQEYIDIHLPYLVHDGFDDLVPYFREQIPILSQNTQLIVSALSQPPSTITSNLEKAGLRGAPLKAKDKSARANINRFLKYLKHGSTKVLRNIAGSVFKVINSFLGSLKEAVAGAPPFASFAIEAIKQIKDHVEAASAGSPTE